MAQYTINISSQAELEEHWSDSSCPNFGFAFDQVTLDECVKINDNTWEATYQFYGGVFSKNLYLS
jgi:hypothetical protein